MSGFPANGPVRVLEWVRSPIDMWNLPRDLVSKLAADMPHVSVMSPATRDEAEALLPEADVVLGFIVRPENIARAVLFFVDNDFVTGVCLPVDGGRTIFAPDSV